MQSLKTKFFSQLRQSTINQDLNQDLESWIRKLRQYGHQNQEMTKYDLFPCTDNYEAMLLQQSQPHWIEGFNILTIVGKDVTVESIMNPAPFLGGTCRAGRLVRDILQQLCCRFRSRHYIDS
jgi:hypothetical protein